MQIFQFTLQTITGERSPLRLRRQRSNETAASKIKAGIQPAQKRFDCHMQTLPI